MLSHLSATCEASVRNSNTSRRNVWNWESVGVPGTTWWRYSWKNCHQVKNEKFERIQGPLAFVDGNYPGATTGSSDRSCKIESVYQLFQTIKTKNDACLFLCSHHMLWNRRGAGRVLGRGTGRVVGSSDTGITMLVYCCNWYANISLTASTCILFDGARGNIADCVNKVQYSKWRCCRSCMFIYSRLSWAIWKHPAAIATPSAKSFRTEWPLTFPAPPVAVTVGKLATKIKQTSVVDNRFVQHRDLFQLPFVKVKTTLK